MAKQEFTDEEIKAYLEHDDREHLENIITNIIQGRYPVEDLKKNIKNYLKV